MLVEAEAPAAPKRVRQLSFKHRNGVIACSPDGKLIAIANSDVTFPLTIDWKPVVEILDAQDGKTIASLRLATDAEQQAITTTEGISDFEVGPLVFSPDGAILAVSTGLGQVKLFNVRSGDWVLTLDDEEARLADMYVIDTQGKVAYKSGRGPFGFRVGEMEQALAMALLETEGE
jgi:WD40 repeat protein